MSNVLLISLFLALVIVPSGTYAHIKNEETQFPDIDFSDARFDIVLLMAAGIIPETPVFEPDRPLSRKDLAGWLALGKGVAAGGENPDVEALARTALKSGLIESLDGDATFGDLDTLFLGGRIASDQPTKTPTKAQAARYLARQFGSGTDGPTLLPLSGLTEGANGLVTQVASKATEDGDNVYIVTIGQTALPMYAHGRVARGPTDLLAWEGRTIDRSLVRVVNGREMWTYLEAKPIAVASVAAAAQERPARAASGQESGYLLYGLIGAIMLLGAGLFFRGKRAG